ncbi:hypothetical protein, partial [Daejeonella sp.]|uniref:hypothetical protein n=1 Tax=Daejeonella sp. TaxID=2805397 RepID=UPI0030C4D623
LVEQLRETANQHSRDSGKGVMEVLLSPEFAAAEPDPVGDAEKRRRKRKQHQQEQSHGLSR